MLDVRKLRMLAALERLGTISAVAAELHLTASGISMQLAALEREVGLELTRRRGRRVELTPAGVVLARHGQDIVDRITLAGHELDDLRAGVVGRYGLTAFPSAARTLVADALGVLAADEDVTLDLRLTTAEPEEALAALLEGRDDLAVIHSYSNVPRELPPGIDARLLGVERVRLAMPASRSRSSVLADYSEDAWIAPDAELTCAVMVERACGLAGFRPRVVARSVDYVVQLAWVAAGVGVALVPESALVQVPGGVVLVDPEVPVERRLFLAARTPDWADPGIRTLVGVLEKAAASRLVASGGTTVRSPSAR